MDYEMYEKIGAAIQVKAIESLSEEAPQERSVEFQVIDDFKNNLPTILSNIEQIKAWANEQTERDRTLVLQTPAEFEDAKKRCAQINRVIESIERKRKDVKKAYIEPYSTFEHSIKEVVTVLTDAKNNLWGQVTEAENTAKKERSAIYSDYWEKISRSNAGKYRSFHQILNRSWLTKAKTDADAFHEMDQILNKIQEDVSEIESLCSDFIIPVLQYYKDGHDLKECLKYYLELTQAEQKASYAAAAAEAGPAAKSIAEPPENSKETDEEYVTVDFRVKTTQRKLSLLKHFLNDNRITYGKVQ